ncbi:MAG: Na+/H+ antiporter NhaA, partial [Bdellovibrionales bacterium]|nr:Na+/H+ antiporter NhaA [Bdellovibrionales bacterium]
MIHSKFQPIEPHTPQPIDTMLAPFRAFFRKEASAGILLIIATLVAMIWANFGDGHAYDHFWHTPLSITLGNFSLSYSLQHWINDGLMAMFFFVVGLEIKREVMAGELSTLRKASLPLVAAIGGMIVPALLYALFNVNGPGSSGWGIPMATDIAFALGVLTLFGNSIPLALKVFLAALAIGDDLGAVLVIAFFYSSNINFLDLIFGGGFLTVLLVCNFIGVRSPFVYALFGIGGLWLAFLLSGVHPTV